jgi:hypothetical protein
VYELLCSVLWLNSLRLRAQASSRIKQPRTARGVPPLKKKQLPPGGRELKGAATAFRAWFGAARGTTAARGSGSLKASFSGEPIFR